MGPRGVEEMLDFRLSHVSRHPALLRLHPCPS